VVLEGPRYTQNAESISDRARAITTASEQAAESLATLKETSEEAFKNKAFQARQGPGLSPAAAALLEAKKQPNWPN
jgi:hypothetical protein